MILSPRLFHQSGRRVAAAISAGNNLHFDHIQLYVQSTKPIHEYAKLENSLNALANKVSWSECSVEDGRNAWKNIYRNPANAGNYKSTNQDVIRQLIFGAGARVRGEYAGKGTSSVLVSMSDQDHAGFHIVVTSPSSATGPDLHPFRLEHHKDFLSKNNDRDGIAVLAFRTGNKDELDEIRAAYLTLHPKLVRTLELVDLGSHRLFEAHAYYLPDKETPDTKTVIRFVDGTLLPMSRTTPSFASDKVFGYNDHWVSNVFDRTKFLETMEEVLGFTPKVNFNAGVVGAGEAIIESTVTGNEPSVRITDIQSMLRNEQQVYLPTNNALSPHGHVYQFLQQLGQGVQHIATRVVDLPKFIARANWYREVTGEGFTFLSIPRSYYGWIQPNKLSLPQAKAEKVIEQLKASNLVDDWNIVKLDIDDAKIYKACGQLDRTVVDEIKLARYSNLHDLLRDHLDEENYLRCVANQVLVDIQGNDVLFQIFTNPILHRDTTEEAPFFEFIQRVCTGGEGAAIQPGCGGFGIRNFITLFLSIELSKCMDEATRCQKTGDAHGRQLALDMVGVFSEQQNVVNPILTSISDAMTAEADLLEKAGQVEDNADLLKGAAKCEETRAGLESEMARLGEYYKKKMKDLQASYQK
eukprot:GEMP01026428.1.p1 GENE.GEMP01026428.1~~GEMP01026428.1.p1  ORF type:complete len:638 (-),score=162.25 GEMP01026428.1:289-2202(-)